MTLEQVVLTMINDKMLDNGQISEKLHSSIQKDIITLSTFNTAAAKNGEQMTVQMNIASESVDWKGIRWIFMQHVRN